MRAERVINDTVIQRWWDGETKEAAERGEREGRNEDEDEKQVKKTKKADEKKASAKKLRRPVFSGGTHRSATEKNTPRDATSGEIKG